MRLLYTVTLLLATIICNSQNPVEEISYKRYDGSIGTYERSNYLVVALPIDNGLFKVTEYYRFTTPKILKKSYTIDSRGFKQGLFMEYDRDGVLINSGNYKNNEREGEWSFFRDDKLHHLSPYINGKREGLIRYYDNDKEIWSWNWKNDKSDGYNKSAFKNGIIKVEGLYVNGEREGEFKRYNKEGRLIKIENYNKGLKEGEYKKYNSLGTLLIKGNYKKDKRYGIWEWYRRDGSLASKENYGNKDVLKEVQFYNKNGVEEFSKNKDVFKGVVDNKRKLSRQIKNYIVDNYKFPKEFRNKGFESKVIVDFVIDTLGYPARIRVKSDGPEAFEKEAERLIKKLPKQKPGRAHNILVEPKFTIPITYRIKD